MSCQFEQDRIRHRPTGTVMVRVYHYSRLAIRLDASIDRCAAATCGNTNQIRHTIALWYRIHIVWWVL